MKSLPKLLSEAQKVFNAYIRKRDSKDGYFRCISCGLDLPVSEMQAGHFYSVGSCSGLRFNEDNCHGQCVFCNTFLHGNLDIYATGLIAKIGAERFQELVIARSYYRKHGHKWSRSVVNDVIEFYKEKAERL